MRVTRQTIKLVRWLLGMFGFGMAVHCAAGETDRLSDGLEPGCVLTSVQDPLGGNGLPQTYMGREFYVDGNHLGWDIALPEGRAVYPIGCGVVRLARSARGYGTLVVVIEHRLEGGTSVENGVGRQTFVDRFLSVYGHLRPTSERDGRGLDRTLRVGDQVDENTVLGYVEHRELNGDGAEHLHLGIRLQSSEAAIMSDPSAWFRGYDGEPSQRRWFADPQRFLLRLRERLGRTATVPEDAGILSTMDVASPMVMRDTGFPSPTTVYDRPTPLDVPAFVPDVPTPVIPRIRYEFRVRSARRVSPPFRLRDEWWRSVTCQNTGTTDPLLTADGWARCETGRLDLFDGSVTLPDHPDWGDHGQIGTVANVPQRCAPVEGAEWRLTDVTTGRSLYAGPVSGLRCVPVGTQDRLQFPD